jgi:hypothetical protein
MASARAKFDANFCELIPSYVLYLMLQPIRESSFTDTHMSRGHAMVDPGERDGFWVAGCILAGAAGSRSHRR